MRFGPGIGLVGLLDQDNIHVQRHQVHDNCTFINKVYLNMFYGGNFEFSILLP